MMIVVRPIAAAVFVGSLLCGCGGSPTMTPPSASVNLSQLVRSSPDASAFSASGCIRCVQYYGEDLSIYKRVGLSITIYKTLHDSDIASPLGTVATPNGWWYVANGGHSNVLVYRSRSDGPIRAPKLDDYGQVPANVAVNPNRRLVAVSNVAAVSGGTGSVSVYFGLQPVGAVSHVDFRERHAARNRRCGRSSGQLLLGLQRPQDGNRFGRRVRGLQRHGYRRGVRGSKTFKGSRSTQHHDPLLRRSDARHGTTACGSAPGNLASCFSQSQTASFSP